jgi:hypothetical protein
LRQIIKNFPTKKGPGFHRFSAEFYQSIKKEVTPVLLELFHKVQKEEILPNIF